MRSILASILLLMLSACSWQQLYYTAQTWQKNACERLVDQYERERCPANANMSYDRYKAQTEPAQK